MLRLYRGISLRSRLLALVLITGLTTAVAISYNYNVLLVAAGTVAVAVFLDLLFRRSSFVLALIMALIQLALAAIISYRNGESLVTVMSEADARLYYYIIQFIVITFLIINLVISIYLVRGRVWLNLLFLGIISDFGFLAFFTYSQNPILGGLAALGLVLIYTALRFQYWRKPKFEATITYPNNLKHRVRGTFTQANCEIREVQDYEYLKFVALSPNESRVFALAALPAETNVRFVKNKLYLNTQENTDLLEGFLREVKIWRRSYKLPVRAVLPVIYSTRTIGGETVAKQVIVHKRSKPDLAYGTAYLVNPAGLSKLLRVTEQLKPARGRLRKRLDSLFKPFAT